MGNRDIQVRRVKSLTDMGFSWQRGLLSLNLISTAPSGQVVLRLLAGRMRSGPTLSPRELWLWLDIRLHPHGPAV